MAQRVSRASVVVGDETVSEMSAGLLALVGVAREDIAADAQQLADKLVHLRVFPDDDGKMNRSLIDTGGTLGVVSQFTLMADTRKGRRPGYAAAADPADAEPLIETLVEHARQLGVTVVTGRFRSTMRVELVNEGPVTLLVDTRKSF